MSYVEVINSATNEIIVDAAAGISDRSVDQDEEDHRHVY